MTGGNGVHSYWNGGNVERPGNDRACLPHMMLLMIAAYCDQSELLLELLCPQASASFFHHSSPSSRTPSPSSVVAAALHSIPVP